MGDMGPLTDGSIRLRSPRHGDAVAIWAHARHPEIEETYWLPIRRNASREEAAELCRELMAGWTGQGRHGPVMIVTSEDADVVIGIVYLPRPGENEIAYGVAPEARGRGIATRALRLACDHLFSERPALTRLELRISPSNVASRRVAERVGFAFRGIERRRSSALEGISEDAVYILGRPPAQPGR